MPLLFRLQQSRFLFSHVTLEALEMRFSEFHCVASRKWGNRLHGAKGLARGTTASHEKGLDLDVRCIFSDSAASPSAPPVLATPRHPLPLLL